MSLQDLVCLRKEMVSPSSKIGANLARHWLFKRVKNRGAFGDTKHMKCFCCLCLSVEVLLT